MELRVLRYFLAVAREENMTKAAALLHVTQPTLSRQLAQLEGELGVKLFRRGQYRIVLTDDGMLLRRRAQEIVELAGWFGDAWEDIEVAATYNLILNAANMVKNGVGVALCFDLDNISDALTFVPLSPKLETGTVLAWKKDQAASPAAEQFLLALRNSE